MSKRVAVQVIECSICQSILIAMQRHGSTNPGSLADVECDHCGQQGAWHKHPPVGFIEPGGGEDDRSMRDYLTAVMGAAENLVVMFYADSPPGVDLEYMTYANRSIFFEIVKDSRLWGDALEELKDEVNGGRSPDPKLLSEEYSEVKFGA